VPPTFKWKDRQRSNVPPPVNPTNGWVTSQNRPYKPGQSDGYNKHQSPFPNRNYGDSQFRSQPLGFPPASPYTMPSVGNLMASPFQMPNTWHSNPNQQPIFNNYGSLLASTPGSGQFSQRRY